MFESFLFNSSIALTWILFIALLPMVFFWWRKAFRIIVKKDYSEVALKKGKSPKNPKKWAFFSAVINIVAGGFALLVIVKVSVFAYYYQDLNFIADTFSSWSEVAGITIWSKIIADFILKQQAHPMAFGRKKKGVTT